MAEMPPIPAGYSLVGDTPAPAAAPPTSAGLPPIPNGYSLVGGPSGPNPDDFEKTPGGLFHFVDAQGNETYSKALPAGAQPFRESNAADVSTAENVAAGAGKSVVDTGKGLYQLGASIGHAAGLVSDDKMASIQADADARKQQDAALMSTTAGKVGYGAGEVGQAVVGGAVAPGLLAPTTLKGATVLGAGMGAIQPVASDESRLHNIEAGAVGGAVGGAIGKTVAGVAQPVAAAAGKYGQDVQTLLDENIPLTIRQQTGSKAAAHVERAADMLGGDSAANFAAEQKAAFNGAVLKRAGATDSDFQAAGMTGEEGAPKVAASPEVMTAVDNRIGDTMDQVAARNPVKVDNQMLVEMGDLEARAKGELTNEQFGPIKSQLDNILSKGNSTQDGVFLDGKAYQNLRTSLGNIQKNGGPTASAAGDLKEVLDDAMTRSATASGNTADVQALTQARQQYRALKQIEGSVDPATGDISVPNLLRGINTKANRKQALYGQGDQSLVGLAKAAKNVIPDTLGNSGTAERSLPALTALETLGSGKPAEAATKFVAGGLGLSAAGRAARGQPMLFGEAPWAHNYLVNGIPGVGAPIASALRSPLIRAASVAAPVGYDRASKEAAVP